MPDAMMNGGFAPYLAQAFTPQGVPGGLFGSSVGTVPGINYGNPFGQNYGIACGMPFGGVPGLGAMPQIGQQHVHRRRTPFDAPSPSLGTRTKVFCFRPIDR